MKNLKVTLYVFVALITMISCNKDDGPEIIKPEVTTPEVTTPEVAAKVTSAILGSVEGFEGPCAKTFDFEAEIKVNGPTTVKYTWLRSDGATSPEVTLEFEEAGDRTVDTSWTLGGAGGTYEGNWQQLKIISPNEMLSNKAEFDLHCDEDAVAITATTSVTGADDFTGECPKKFDFESEIESSGPATIKYTWLRSDGATSPEETLEFEEAGTKTVTKSWTLGESGSSYEGNWQQLKIISPNEMLSNKAEFDLHCDEDTIAITATTTVIGEDEFTGECPKKFDFESEIEVSGPATIKYTWLRSDGGTAPEYTLEFEEAGTQTVTTSWTLGESGESYENFWQQLKIIAPEEILSNKAEFTLNCIKEESIELVSLNPISPNELYLNDRVEFTFNYTTSEPSGVRIFGRPFTNGNITPDYAAHGSPINPTGDGTNSGYFTIQNNPVHVDQIRFQIWDADQSNLLHTYFVDVDYEFISHNVELTTIDPVSPAMLCLNESVEFTFAFRTNEPTGVRIFGRPFTSGSPTPGYGAHGSPIHAIGEGVGSGYFTLTNSGNNIDQIRFQMWDADQNNLLYEYFEDVNYEFSSHCITMTSISPSSPASLSTDEKINFSFEYRTDEPTGVRIFGRPVTNGILSTGYAAHGSPINSTGEGTNTGYFTLKTPGKVDQIRFQMWDANQDNLLHEYYVDVDYEFTND